MQREIQNVIWILGNEHEKILEIDSNGNRVYFSRDIIEKSYNYNLFSLYDVQNDLIYSIDLDRGEFIINGIPFEICRNISGRMISFSNLGIDYRKGIIQYKESKPICIGFNEDDTKPSQEIIDMVASHFRSAGYSVGINNPYSNSACASMDPNKARTKTFMIEVNKAVYLQSDGITPGEKFHNLKTSLSELYDTLLEC
jgi:hypothetical protein